MMMSAAGLAAIVELHRGHDCPTWQAILVDVAALAVNRTEYREWKQRHGIGQTMPGGHLFVLDERNGVDPWAFDSDIAMGPYCVACEDGITWYGGVDEPYFHLCPKLRHTANGDTIPASVRVPPPPR